MSEHQSLGLSVQVHAPGFGVTYTPKGSSLGEFTFDTYSHTITTGIGFDTLNVSKAGQMEEAYWWLANACGAHVEVQDDTGVIVWEGRVNTVGITAGGYSIQRGPLLDMANCVIVTYQLLDSNAAGNASSGEAQEEKCTDPANHEMSQARYGIQKRILAAGTVTTARARNIRNAYLTLNAWPRVPKLMELGGTDVSISLECKGYYYWLNYPYRLVNTTAMTTVSAKIAAVLAADPNSFFSGPNEITANTLAVPALEDQNRAGNEVIADLVALGDANYARYVFGIWENRIARYSAAPTIFEYQQRTDDRKQVIEDMASHTVQPWSVLPSKWIVFTGINPGSLAAQVGAYQGSEAENTMFIEQVKFTAPYGLSLSGGVVNTLVQRMAQWGLTGA